MFTPLDVCIRVVSAVEYVVKSRFEGVRAWAEVEDAREETSSIMIMIADSEEVSSFCNVEIDCFKVEGRRRKEIVMEVFASMKISEGPGLHLEEFPVDETLIQLKPCDPLVTTGTRYRLDGSKTIVERTLEVRMRAFGGQLRIDDTESLDFDELGYDVSDRVGLLLAIYRSIKKVPISP